MNVTLHKDTKCPWGSVYAGEPLRNGVGMGRLPETIFVVKHKQNDIYEALSINGLGASSLTRDTQIQQGITM